jgi:hypothetical protein
VYRTRDLTVPRTDWKSIFEPFGIWIQTNPTASMPSGTPLLAFEPTAYRFSVATAATVFYLQELGISGDFVEYGPFILSRAHGARAEQRKMAETFLWIPYVATE